MKNGKLYNVELRLKIKGNEIFHGKSVSVKVIANNVENAIDLAKKFYEGYTVKSKDFNEVLYFHETLNACLITEDVNYE